MGHLDCDNAPYIYQLSLFESTLLSPVCSNLHHFLRTGN
jgi:hypothetical protein